MAALPLRRTVRDRPREEGQIAVELERGRNTNSFPSIFESSEREGEWLRSNEDILFNRVYLGRPTKPVLFVSIVFPGVAPGYSC